MTKIPLQFADFLEVALEVAPDRALEVAKIAFGVDPVPEGLSNDASDILDNWRADVAREMARAGRRLSQTAELARSEAKVRALVALLDKTAIDEWLDINSLDFDGDEEGGAAQ